MLTKELAKEAIQIVLPAILRSMKTGLVKRTALHIVVAQRRTGTEEDFLHQHSVGLREQWPVPFDKIAQSKTLITLRTGLPSAEVQLLRPDLLKPGDTKYWGSAVRGTIVVAASGVEPYFDEMFSNWTADTCMALLKRMRKAIGDSSGDFI